MSCEQIESVPAPDGWASMMKKEIAETEVVRAKEKDLRLRMRCSITGGREKAGGEVKQAGKKT